MTCKAKSLCLIKNQTGNKQVIKRYPLQHDRGDTLIGMCFSWKEKFSRHINSTYQSPDWKTMSERQHLGSKKSLWYTERFTLTLGLPANHCFPGALWTLRPKKNRCTFPTCYQTFKMENSPIFDVVTCSFLLSIIYYHILSLWLSNINSDAVNQPAF